MAVSVDYIIYPFTGQSSFRELEARGISSGFVHSSYAIWGVGLILQRGGDFGWILEGKETPTGIVEIRMPKPEKKGNRR